MEFFDRTFPMVIPRDIRTTGPCADAVVGLTSGIVAPVRADVPSAAGSRGRSVSGYARGPRTPMA
jgi:hypothetical protein